MKKVISIILSVLMAMLLVVPAFAAEKTVEPAATGYATYDKAGVASGDFSDLTYDQIASLIFDFIDKKIAEVTADFNTFEAQVFGQTVEIPVDITGIDSLLQYKDHLADLGGDFANLDPATLDKTRADGDIALMESFFSFMAANSDTLGKVFGWTEENRFDYGKVGEYIESLDETDAGSKAIKDFYHKYLLGNDIQKWFVRGIAKEMDYTIGEGEDFDTVINNGIINKVVSLCEKFLSAEAIEIIRGYNLKTTDVYTLIKNFFKLVQDDKWEEVTMYYTYILDNLIRPVLKVTFGYTPAVGATVGVPAAFTEAYKDLAALKALSGGKVLFQEPESKAYYQVTIGEGEALSANEVTYTETFTNFEPPVVNFYGKDDAVIGTYTPSNPDITSYNPTVYTDASYKDLIPEIAEAAGKLGVQVKTEALPEAIASIVAGEGKSMTKFCMKAGEPVNQDITIDLKDIETAANETIAQQLPSIQETMVEPAVKAAVEGGNTALKAAKESLGALGAYLPESLTATAEIKSVTVELAYTGYATEDTFVCEVSVTPHYDVEFGGNAWDFAQYLGITKESILTTYVEPVVAEAIKNPVATIVVENLNGSKAGLNDLFALMGFIDTDFVVDYDLLDFARYYDDYNGVIGQMNRILCGALKMFLSDDGYDSLGLEKDINSNLTENLQKLCEKADSLIKAAKTFVDANQFGEFTKGLSDLFASDHGFNANMVYEMDFSNLENLYVCALRLGCDMFVADNSGLLYDIHMIIEDLDSLDAMLVGVSEYALAKVLADANKEVKGFNYAFTPLTAQQLKALGDKISAEDILMTDLVDLLYYVANYAVPMVNDMINGFIDTLNGETGDLPHVQFALNVQKGKTWEETLGALVDRALDLVGGLVICADEAAQKTTAIEKLSTVLSTVLPMNTMFSNYTGLTQAKGYIFDKACDGDFEGILSYFEVKEDAVAGEVSVTKALINCSDYIVDAFFPNTVETELYAESETVQQTFTGEISDIGIASRNMKSIDGRKANLLACIFDLLKESKTLLPYLAGTLLCKVHTFGEWQVVTKVTCETAGEKARVCSVCGYKESETEKATGHSFGEYTVTKAATCTAAGTKTRTCSACKKTESITLNALGHSYGAWTTAKQPTCTQQGEKKSVCSKCGDTKTEKIAATGQHVDADGNKTCDTCGKDLSEKKPETFIDKIKSFFNKILDWFKNLFKF